MDGDAMADVYKSLEINDSDSYDIDDTDKSNYDTYRTYLKDIRSKNYKILTLEEEIELGKRIKKKDKEAVRKLVTSNLRLVVGIAKKFIRDDVDFMDLVEIGNEALVKAAWNFDYTKNVRFSTYATDYIIGGLYRNRSLYQTGSYLNTYLTIRLSRFLKVYNSLDKYSDKDKLIETIKILNISEEEGIYLLNLSFGHESLNNKIIEDSEEEFINTIPNDLNIEDEIINKIIIKEIFNDTYLNTREKQILKLKYGIGISNPLNLEEIGKIMNLQPTNISRIEKAALRKIRIRNRDKQYLKK